MTKKATIIGAGLGGLATALRLNAAGYKVTIIEKNDKSGGRLNQLKKDGFTFDTGPSFFSMSYEFEEFAKDCGIAMPFEFVEIDPLYSVNIRGIDRPIKLYKDIDKLAEQLEPFEPDFKAKFERYIKKCGELFHDTVDVAIKRNFNGLFDYITALMQVNPKHLPVLAKTFWQQVTHHFESKEVRQIVSLVAFFLGRTPFDTNAVYTLLSYTEFVHNGYYNVKGGMYKIVEGLVEELKKRDVEFIYNTEIVDVEKNHTQVKSFIDQHGQHHAADLFVANSDAAYFRGRVMKHKSFSEERLKKMDWTMGYLTFYIGLNTKLPQIELHNYYLGNNFEEYAQKIINNPGIMEKPYYYVNVLSRYNEECAPEGHESLFFVCPVPNLIYKKEWHDAETIVESIIEDFSERIAFNIQPHIVSKTIFTPQTWADTFNLYQGAGLGLSHAMLQIGAFRPNNIDEKYSNLFYVGASTVPGAGLPMAIISSKLVTQRITQNDK
ncbi:MAG: phytoene desaturase family protein [Breznakibacter sp.]